MHTPAPAAPRQVLVLGLDHVELLDLAGPVQVFEAARQRGAGYEVHVVGPDPSATVAHGITALTCRSPLPAVGPRDHILVPGLGGGHRESAPPTVLDWLRTSHGAGAHISSVCSGAFILARAGLLDDRRCTTHWELVDLLRTRFPRTVVSDNALFVADGTITTSAGVASGIDLALWLVERDHGPRLTAQVAHDLVVYLRRDGTNTQASVYLDYRTHLDPMVHRAQDWIQSDLTRPITLDGIGRELNISGRHLARIFKASTGITPLEYVQLLRVEHARTLLNNPALTMEVIAAQCGFGDVRSFRRVWRQRFGASPSAARPAAAPRAAAWPARP